MKKFVRKLQKMNKYSYSISIPIELIKEFKWKERQKLEITFGGRKEELTIKDWKK